MPTRGGLQSGDGRARVLQVQGHSRLGGLQEEVRYDRRRPLERRVSDVADKVYAMDLFIKGWGRATCAGLAQPHVNDNVEDET